MIRPNDQQEEVILRHTGGVHIIIEDGLNHSAISQKITMSEAMQALEFHKKLHGRLPKVDEIIHARVYSDEEIMAHKELGVFKVSHVEKKGMFQDWGNKIRCKIRLIKAKPPKK